MDTQNPALQSYVIETRELLAQLESMLLDLEVAPSHEAIDAVFRALHTIKGGGSMFGFPVLSAFVHHFEDAFDLVRVGKISISRALLDAALAGRDHMISLVEAADSAESAPEIAQNILSQLSAAVENSSPAPLPQISPWRIHFAPAANALKHGMRPDLLLAELGGLGQCTIQGLADDLPNLEQIDPTENYLSWVVDLQTEQPFAAIEAVFLFADDAQLKIEQVAVSVEDTAPPKTASEPQSAVATAPKDPTPRGSAPQASVETVRVPAPKLDSILDKLGELVISQARLNQIAGRLGNADLTGLAEEFERLVTGLRDTTLAIRMLPIETVFGKFRRVVRDLSIELGKDVALDTEGGETEIDKNVLDRLSEPLVHIIRNSIDHGLETSDERIALGKSAQGRVRLAARQDAGEILIEIQDDGRGLNLDRIRAKAIEREVIAADAVLSEQQLTQLIFAPGFSTAEKITNVSGRGVGMDAVMSTINALRGSVEVASRKGEGTKLTLRLPLTLAIIDGLLVRLGEDTYVLPLVSVEECAEFDIGELSRESGRSMLSIRNELVPFVDLCAVFETDQSHELRRRVVIVRADGMRVGLVVDDILGQQQTVIKQMSDFHDNVEGFAGSTILGDGTVALIIDVAMLLRGLPRREALPLAA